MSIVGVVLFLSIAMLALWIYVQSNSGKLLSYEHPSGDIQHSIEKGIFLESLHIISKDGITIDSVAIAFAWIEKKPYWKSDIRDLDHLRYYSDEIVICINFVARKAGEDYHPGYGTDVLSFSDQHKNASSLYIDDYKAQLSYSLKANQFIDTLVLKTDDGRQLLLERKH